MKSGVWIFVICASVLTLAPAVSAQINVTTPNQGVTDSSNCSLQEAMYATQFGGPYALGQTDPDISYKTGCTDPSGLWYQIVLPGGTLQFGQFWDGDGHNPFGPTATPIVCNFIDIVGNGTTLEWTGTGYARLFAVGYAQFSPTSGAKTGTFCGAVVPSLTLQNVYVKGFQVKGGDGTGGGGGGLGAGGAIYIGRLPGKDAPNLTIQNSTFDGNTVTGGSGGECGYGGGQIDCGGGGGGVSGAGGGGIGGGGGGSRGDGGLPSDGGGGGGGTVYGNGDANGNTGGAAGVYCGGNGGDSGSDGHGGTCPGGGGGGGGAANACNLDTDYCGGNGGTGAYGGGGGGGSYLGNGGNGGFGGGGGGANCCSYAIQSGATIRGGYGGNGGFGAGGGMGQPSSVVPTGGSGGDFAGSAQGFLATFTGNGGSGAGLGGAIFNDGGSVTIQNSTFANNKATGGGYTTACCGQSEGGAIFSRDGSLTVESSTIANNNVGLNGVGGTGITVFGDGPAGTTSFTLHNTIIANNGSPGAAYPCELLGKVAYSVGFYPIGNLVTGDAVPKYSSSYLPQQDDCEANLASSANPQLGTLQLNSPGNTPTMAIGSGSPAVDAGYDYSAVTDGITGDQRGVARPQGQHVDIGAYEAQLTPLMMQVSPAGGGYTNPSPGIHEENPGAVVNVSATPFSGYYFLNWSGNVALASSSSTTVTMSQAQTITANFQLHDFHWDSVDPSPLSLKLGGSASSTLTLSSLGNFADNIGLAASGMPTGITASFSPTSLTPSQGGTASTTVTLTAGPSAMPQNFTQTVTGSSTGLSGALSHDAQWPVTMLVTAADIVNVVNQNQALGCIDKSGIAQSLNAKLNNFQRLSTDGHLQSAVNSVAAFDYETQAQAAKHISSTCTDGSGTKFSPPQTLIADTTYLLSSVGAAKVQVNPIMGSVVNSSNNGVSGVTVNLLSSSKTVVTTAVTDDVGFYYFADTSSVVLGTSYTVTVTPPGGYKKTSTPASQTFKWSGSEVKLANFLLN